MKVKYWIGNDTFVRFKEGEIEFVEINGFDWDEILKYYWYFQHTSNQQEKNRNKHEGAKARKDRE